MGRLYSFDTSSLLNGRRDLLPPSTFRTLWSNIEDMILEGSVRAVDEVRNELSRREDEVHLWAKAQDMLFVPIDEDIQRATTLILGQHPRLLGVAGGGRNGADPFVIALARARNGIVVTEETPSGRLDRPRIPDVCKALQVPCVNLVGFVAAQSWIF